MIQEKIADTMEESSNICKQIYLADIYTFFSVPSADANNLKIDRFKDKFAIIAGKPSLIAFVNELGDLHISPYLSVDMQWQLIKAGYEDDYSDVDQSSDLPLRAIVREYLSKNQELLADIQSYYYQMIEDDNFFESDTNRSFKAQVYLNTVEGYYEERRRLYSSFETCADSHRYAIKKTLS